MSGLVGAYAERSVANVVQTRLWRLVRSTMEGLLAIPSAAGMGILYIC